MANIFQLNPALSDSVNKIFLENQLDFISVNSALDAKYKKYVLGLKIPFCKLPSYCGYSLFFCQMNNIYDIYLSFGKSCLKETSLLVQTQSKACIRI